SDFSASNLPDLAKMNADPEVMRYFPATLNSEESVALLQRITEHQRINGYSLFSLHLKESDAFVGWCGLMVVPFEAHFTPAVEIGWRLNKIFWGKGLATEAAEAVLRLGFLELGLSEIVSFTAELNQPSIRVMQKIGMQSEPKDAFDHPKLPTNHPLQRHILYRLTKSLWLEQRECSKTP
ncbi:MAG: GNAT family N-acetyltransferase, partial [bacterium]